MKSNILFTLLILLNYNLASAEQRFLGEFSESGEPRLFNISTGSSLKVIRLTDGHTTRSWPRIYKTTLSRHGFSASGSYDKEKMYQFFTERFNKVMTEFSQPSFLAQVRKAASLFGVDPAIVLASIAGEQVFNRDLEMLGQNVASHFIPDRINFAGAYSFENRLNQGAFSLCKPETSDYWSWVCLNQMWNLSITKASGLHDVSHVPSKYLVNLNGTEETLQGQLRPKTGYSYGVAQLSLARALMLTKDLHQKAPGKFAHHKLADIDKVMTMILDDESSIYLTAANTARCIEVYNKVAGYDISRNLGVLVTLFNLGYEYEKAIELRNHRIYAEQNKKPIPMPQENFMGWFMNSKRNEIQALF